MAIRLDIVVGLVCLIAIKALHINVLTDLNHADDEKSARPAHTVLPTILRDEFKSGHNCLKLRKCVLGVAQLLRHCSLLHTPPSSHLGNAAYSKFDAGQRVIKCSQTSNSWVIFLER